MTSKVDSGFAPETRMLTDSELDAVSGGSESAPVVDIGAPPETNDRRGIRVDRAYRK